VGSNSCCPYLVLTEYRESGGGDISFDCSETRGAVLLLGTEAVRKDALTTNRYRAYIVKHHTAWLEFARTVKGRDISLEDLILVTGCDKTSKRGPHGPRR